MPSKLLLLSTNSITPSMNIEWHGYDEVFSLKPDITQENLSEYCTIDKFKNELYFQKIIFPLFSEVRELYVDFIATWPDKKISSDQRTFKEIFTWNDISLWWITQLNKKDTVDDKYFYSLVYLFFIRKILQGRKFSITVYTDDLQLHKAITKNYPLVESIFSTPNRSIFSKLFSSNFLKYIKIFTIEFIFLEFIKFFLGPGDLPATSNRNNIYFATQHPINWREENGVMVDRHFSDAPLIDATFGYHSVYLVNIYPRRKDYLHPIQFTNRLKNLNRKSKRPVIFLDYFIKRADLWEIFINFKDRFKFFTLRHNSEFKNSFIIDGIDSYEILLNELTNSFNGIIQSGQKLGISFQRFLENLKKPETIVIYSELIIDGKITAHCIKSAKHDHKCITIQHAMNCRNKMFSYHRKSEFSKSDKLDAIHYSPTPDLYLVQGQQFAKILEEFYPTENIHIIGCIKLGIYHDTLKNRTTIASKCRSMLNIDKEQQIILLAPSVSDGSAIFSLLKNFTLPKQYRILLSPHPVIPIEELKNLEAQIGVTAPIEYIANLKTYELLTVADLVICGYSTVALEAALFGVPSARAANYKVFPMFELDPEIPPLRDAKELSDWIAKQRNFKTQPEIYASLAQRYFNIIDGNAAEKMWESIKMYLSEINTH